MSVKLKDKSSGNSSPPPLNLPAYYDNAASFTLSPDKRQFIHGSLQELATPIVLQAASEPLRITHSGNLACLPSLNGMNRAYYSPDLSATLISLGHLQSCGAFYTCDPARPRTHVLIYSSVGGPLIGTAQRTHGTNMLPADLTALALDSALTASPYCGVVAATKEATAPSPPPGLSGPGQVVHRGRRLTAEQIKRCDVVEIYHELYHHPSDASLSEIFDTGKAMPSTFLTGADVRNNRFLRGPCNHCLAGKFTGTSHPSSTTLPAQVPGELVSFDPHLLHSPAPGGYTHEVSYSDEHTGFQIVVGAPSKSVASMTAATTAVMARYFNANGHRLQRLHGDAENVNRALVGNVGLLGVRLGVAGPGEHAQRLERNWRTVTEHSSAVLSSMCYWLPSTYEHELHKDAADVRNHIPNTQSRPLTPEEALAGRRTPLPLLFGTVCMVTQFEEKRGDIAEIHGVSPRGVAKSEVGVYMGMDRLSDLPRFLLANGAILPRKVYTALGRHVVPFNWLPKHVLRIPLPPSLDDVGEDSVSGAVVNTVVQVPDAQASAAVIAAITGTPPVLSLPSEPLEIGTQSNSSPIPVPAPAVIQMRSQLAELTSLVRRDIAGDLTVREELLKRASALRAPSVTPSSVVPTVPLVSIPAVHTVTPQSEFLSSPSPVPPPSQVPVSLSPPSQVPVSLSPPSPVPLRRSPRFLKGTSFHSALVATLLRSQRPAVLRKSFLVRDAAARNQEFRRAHPSIIHNRATSVRPVPIPPAHSEMSFRQAQRVFTPEQFEVATAKELTKQFVTYQALKTIQPKDVEPDAVFLRSHLLYKWKMDGRYTCRMPLDGKNQPPATYGDTWAGVSDPANRIVMLALDIAYVVTHDKVDKLICFNADVPGAFLQNKLPRSETGGLMLYTRMHPLLPVVTLGNGQRGPLPNSLAELKGSGYGLKNANRIHDKEFVKVMLRIGYTQHPCDQYVFRKRCPIDPTDFCHFSTHVDDLGGQCTSTFLFEELKAALKERYGEDMEFHINGSGICGQQQERTADHIQVHMGKAIRAAVHSAGYDGVPGALTPSIVTPGGLFGPSTGPLLSPQHAAEFATANGKLIHTLPVRHDIQMVLKHLCTKTAAPTTSDELMQQQMYRFLKSHPDRGPCFSLKKEHYPDGVVLHGSSDASHATHTETGYGHSAYTISVGKGNGVMVAYSGPETNTVSLSPHGAEYMAGGRLARAMLYYRQFAEGLGYPQTEPTKWYTDSETSISLTSAPAVSRNSRHIEQYAHLLRHLYKAKEIDPRHLGTHEIIPNGLTKTLGPTDYIYHQHQLFGAFRS